MEKQLSRRSFLKLFGAAAPVAAVAPTYFFSPIGGWKSDVIINPNDVADVQVWEDSLKRDVYGWIMKGVKVEVPAEYVYSYKRRQIGMTQLQEAMWQRQKRNCANVRS